MTMHSMLRDGMVFVALSFMLLFGLATNAAAQAQAGGTGQVVGTVFDSTGALIPQTKVTLNNKATGLTREETSSDEGQYRFILVPIGVYTVTFNKSGFKTYKVEVEVTVGAAVTVNGKLELGEVSQVVEVTATALIESTQANPDSLFGVRSIEALPINGRRFHDFASLAPTVQIEPQRTGISFAGQRGINANVSIDGADYNEPFFGGIRGGERAGIAFTIPQEAISQFQVVSNGYSVEFGRSSGGILNATTKSGTNNWHGSAFFVARNGELANQDAFDRQVITNLYEEGGSLGGAIRHDKAFLFAAFERQTNDIPRKVLFSQLVGLTPAANQTEAFNFFNSQQGPFSATNDALTGLGKLDFQPNPSHRLSVTYHYSRNTAENAVQTGNVLPSLSTRALSDEGAEGDRTNTATGQWTAIFSSRVVMETRGQYSLENRPRTANSIQAGLNTSIGVTGTRNFLPTTLDDWRAQIASNLTWTIGTHAVKFGGEYNHINAEQFFKFNQFGVFSFFTSNTGAILQSFSNNCGATSPCAGGNNRADNTAISYSLNIGNGQLQATLHQIAFFIQDQWRLTPRFTVTAGFRWEGYVNPQPDVSNTALYNQVKNFPFPIGKKVDPAFIPSNYRQYMPRLGIAWDPRGDAKTVIRANAGIFYATTPLLLYANSLASFRATPADLSVTLPFALPTGYTCNALYTGDKCNTVYSQFLHSTSPIDLNKFQLGNLPILTPKDIANIVAGLGLSPNPFQGSQPFATANNYESPRSSQWNVEIEREITRGWMVGADFLYVNTVHLQRNYDVNLPAPLVCNSLTVVGCTSVDLSLRPCFGVTGSSACNGRQRPIGFNPGITIPLFNITLRESTARSLYKAMTARSEFRRGRYQFQAYYTLGYNYSNDDNERSATGYTYDNPFNLAPEYNFSNLDSRHLFLINGLVDLPWGFTVSALSRIRSGHPVDPVIGSPANGAESSSFSTGDRAFLAPGVPFKRNFFRDRATKDVDLRLGLDVLKLLRLNLREGMKLSLAADFFNVFNFKNIVFTGDNDGISGNNRRYGLGVGNQTSGANNGQVIPANVAFLRLKDPSFCLAVNPAGNKGCYDTNNFPGANGSIPPFTVQLGIRFQF